ncbi:Uncharacterised protein [Mycobacterium tuberculosis]|uniref:Uncharacterized protein n=1 Tax=Mycobacterium tuberculosis TaxID=1773 RepID=A0A0U0TPD5_MYCTX|nr:Uncharacterised protein [Mycobacterium tuberculosis]COX83765.1 Uncharacterised protein [Mycobacterium tuberculosis]
MGSPAPRFRPGTTLAATDEIWCGAISISPALVMARPGAATNDRAASSLRNRLRM